MLTLLAGCGGDAADQRFDEYQLRMSRVLEVEPPLPQELAVPSYPQARALQRPVARASIGMLDLLALGDCELHTLVAERNSSLGKLAGASTRLIYELDFLRLAPKCIEVLANEEAELREQLRAVVNAKREQLPRTIWEAFLGSAEYRSFWRRPIALADYPQAQAYAADDALVVLFDAAKRWLGGDYNAASSEIEAQLQALLSGDGGYLLLSLTKQAQGLEVVNTMIAERLSGQALCVGQQSLKATALNNVVGRFFIDDIQAWSADVQSRLYTLLPRVQALELLLAAGEVEAFRDWRQQRDLQLEDMSQAPKEHVETLYPLMKQCQVLPG